MYVPPGHSPPFEVVDDLHHGAWLIITAALGLVVSLVCFLIRLYVRLMLIPPFSRDDWVLLGATIVAVLQAILVFYACSRGLGTSVSLVKDGRLALIQTLIATSDAIALIIIYLSKCCVVAIYLRLTPQKSHNRASWATLALCTIWVIPAIFVVLVNCELNTSERTHALQCPDLYTRWQFIAAVDVITEVVLFFLAVVLLKGLFMSTRRKLAVGFAFIFRFPLIILSIIHISTLRTAHLSRDPTLASVEPAVWMQAELHYALVACSIFCLRPFMAAVSTNYGTAGDSTLESSMSTSNPKDGSYGSASSNSASRATRSRSRSHVHRKRPGPGDSNSVVGLSGSRAPEQKRIANRPLQGVPDVHAQGALDRGSQWHGDTDTKPEARLPVCRSMFRAGTRKTFAQLEDRMHGAPSSATDSDLIELMERPHVRCESSGDTPSGDRMVIRKDVHYSIQYEDEDQARREGKAHEASVCTTESHCAP